MTPIIAAACRAAGVSRTTVYKHRRESAAFAEQWDTAELEGLDRLELAAFNRATDGVPEPLVSAGKLVTDAEGRPVYVTRASDSLARFVLERRHPAYKPPPTDVRMTVEDGEQVRALLEERFARLAAAMALDAAESKTIEAEPVALIGTDRAE